MRKLREFKDALKCKHRGLPTGVKECRGCGDGVKLVVFRCAVHGHCTVGRKVAKEIACCVYCREHEEA